MTAPFDEPRTIQICEVGPRDGLQSEKRLWSVGERIEFIDRLTAAGLTCIEAVSFVNPKRVPQMADAEAVMAGIQRRKGVVYAGLALNMRGLERAIDARVDEIRYAVVASETFSQRNQGTTIDETLRAFEEMSARVGPAEPEITAVIAASFGCPFEGVVPTERVVTIANRLIDAGARCVVLADTIGGAVPTQVVELIEAVHQGARDRAQIGCHFHNTRNTGFANAVAAVGAGVRLLDSSIGGIGGCPFAPKATGNIATEDLCHMLRNMGYVTSVDLDALIGVAQWVEACFGVPLPGQVMKAGPFPEAAKARATAAE